MIRIRSIVIVVIVTIFSGCSSSTKRFPDYDEIAAAQTEIPVVLDLFAYRDLAGAVRGYNQDAVDKYVLQAMEKLETTMSNQGFTIKIIAELNGLGAELKEDTEYVISKDWKSTDVTYSGVDLNNSTNPWLTTSNREFLLALINTARRINISSKKDQNYVENGLSEKAVEDEEKTTLKISELAVPASLIDSVNSDIVMFVIMDGSFQKLSKSLPKGIVTGVASAVVTGGTAIAYAPGTKMTTDIIVFNIKTRKILWHNRAKGVPSVAGTAINSSIGTALVSHPDSDGETWWSKRSKRRRR